MGKSYDYTTVGSSHARATTSLPFSWPGGGGQDNTTMGTTFGNTQDVELGQYRTGST
jgi:hypothetical protein